MKILLAAVLMILLLCAPAVKADLQDVEYLVIIEDNGNTVVVISIEGSGLVSIPIQEDVEVSVEGALYIMEGDSIDVSIGETGAAYILYTTSMLTSKTGNEWEFKMPLVNSENLEVTVAMPKDTNLMHTEPGAVIESGEILQLHWKGEVDRIKVRYYFDIKPGDIPEGFEQGVYLIAVMVLVVMAAGAVVFYWRKGKVRKTDKKQNIMKTLSGNEVKIVKTLLENGGEMKRSRLERKLDIAKSSLAATLKNLERKNILEVDRTSASHYVRFTKWFDEL